MFRTSFLLQKITKENNSVNTGDRVMVLALCNSPHGPLSVYQVSLNYLQYSKHKYVPTHSKRSHQMQCFCVFFMFFFSYFINAYVVGSHLHCIDKLMQFK